MGIDVDTKLIKYMIENEYAPHYFPLELTSAVDKLGDYLKNTSAKIVVYPDAVVKRNGFPNGTALIMPVSETILIPSLLRDPGCGYLTFKVNLPPNYGKDAVHTLGNRLNSLINEDLLSGEKQQRIFQKLSLADIFYDGIHCLKIPKEDETGFFNHKFDVDPIAVKISADESKLLENDLMHLTNTVEIRKNKNEYIGFIHSGCHYFPYLLIKKFLYLICQYAHKNQLASLAQIKNDYFGVPLHSELGQNYFQWIKAAMNYAVVSRYLIFTHIKTMLQTEFDIEISLLNDITHAGIFDCKDKNQLYTVSTRGVQPLYNPTNKMLRHPFRLVAGQKESIALLVEGVSSHESTENWIQHGTSYQIPTSDQLSHFFTSEMAEAYIHDAFNSYCNTDLDANLSLVYSFNTLVAQTYQSRIGLIKPLAILTPLINIHGKALIGEI